MEIVAIIILAVLLLLAGGALVILQSRSSAATLELERARVEFERSSERCEDLETRLDGERLRSSEYQARVAELTARSEESAKAHDEARRNLEQTFKALSSDALKASSEQFLHLAKQKLEGEKKDATAELEKRKQAIEHLVRPIRETLDKYQVSVQKLEESRKEAYGSMTKQVELLSKDQQLLRGETAKLVNALRRPEVRGRWGEMQLRRVAELAGMIEHCDFTEQETTNVDGRSYRPDMIVMLPSDRRIVIDAKAPLDAYLRALESANADERTQCMIDHTRQIEERVTNLASKDYAAQFDHTPDFVVLFIPGESFLQAAMQQKPELLESAMERGVVIATPSTLISLLKVVALGWREEQLAENARRIADAGRELHKRLGTAFAHFDKLGRSLQSTIDAFNKTAGSLERNVLPQARRIDELGARSSKELPDQLPEIEIVPRHITALPTITATPDHPGGRE